MGTYTGTLPPFVKGGPLRLVVTAHSCSSSTPVDLPDTECYLYLDSQSDPTKRIRLVYVPNGQSNDATREQIAPGVRRLVFLKPSEWTRTNTNVVAGKYDVYVRAGPETGTNGVLLFQTSVIECIVPLAGAL